MGMNELFSEVTLSRKTFRLVTRDIEIYHADSIDEIVDRIPEEEFIKDERFPYFFAIWDSGVVLANVMLESVYGIEKKTILELGAGTGITGVSLATGGARVIFTDYEEFSLELCARNCVANGIENYDVQLADWREFPTIDEPIDIVVAADVLYEKKQVEPLYQTVKSYLDKGTPVYLADPNRGHIKAFLELVRQGDYNIKTLTDGDSKFGRVNIYQIERK